MFKDAQIPIVDDQDANVLLLVEILKQAGYTKLVATTDPRRFLPLFVDYRPDIILLDLHMPHLDGFALLDRLKVMKSHTTIGASILSGSEVPLLRLAEEIALTHHERWDGRGYPQGLEREAIPLAGRVVAVADAFDAMTTDRPYRRALPYEMALDILKNGGGGQWDPAIVDVLLTTAPHADSVEASESRDRLRAQA